MKNGVDSSRKDDQSFGVAQRNNIALSQTNLVARITDTYIVHAPGYPILEGLNDISDVALKTFSDNGGGEGLEGRASS